MSQLTASQIKCLLGERARTNGHVYFEEVTDYGRYQKNGRQSRIDALAIKIGYSKLQLWGYEIKVSRRDFVADEKWHQYMEMCNSLYFVCPHGVIGKDEVPAEAGLMYVSKKGNMVRTVKKAPYRTVQYRPEYFMGMIFNKLNLFDAQDRESRLRRALELQKLNGDALDLGTSLRSALALKLRTQQNRQDDLETKLTRLEEVEAYLKDEGVLIDGRTRSWGQSPLDALKSRRQRVLKDMDTIRLVNEMRNQSERLERLADRLDKEMGDPDADPDTEEEVSECASSFLSRLK